MTTGEILQPSADQLGKMNGEQPVDPKLLELLVCPITKQPLIYDSKARELVSKAAGLAFPIRDGVPVMLEDEARRLDEGN
jgi:uncharacterized protein YbaR (Trm112 family)